MSLFKRFLPGFMTAGFEKASKPPPEIEILDQENGKRIKYDGVIYARDESHHWRNEENGNQPPHGVYMELYRQQNKLQFSRIYPLLKNKPALLDEQTGATVQTDGWDHLITTSDGNEYISRNRFTHIWQTYPEAHDLNGGRELWLQDICERVKFLNDRPRRTVANEAGSEGPSQRRLA